MSVIINGNTGVSGVDGSASTPAVQGNDANTGMFFPAADTIAFAEGGTEVMRINSNGNVGIGTTSPAAPLHVSGYMYMQDPNNAVFFSNGSTGAYYFRKGTTSSYTDQMIIDSSGRVTTPFQPAFLAYTASTTNTTVTSGNAINFTSTMFNVGSNWNTSTSRFTAPVAGKYYLSINIYTANGASQKSLVWRKNGSDIILPSADAIVHYQGTVNIGDFTLSGNTILDLSAGDYIQIAVRGGGANLTYYQGHSYIM